MKWFLPAMLACVISMTVGCSVGDEDAFADIRSSSTEYQVIDGLFKGEWTVNKQVVDTARLVVNADMVMRVRLPESYLLGLCFPEGVDMSHAPLVLSNTPSTIAIYPQGYSDQAQYNDFDSTPIQSENAKTNFRTCSFQATIGGEPYNIGLLSNENATAVMQKATGQWTLGIPVNAFLVTNLATGQTEEHRLSIPVTLYYNTTERIR